MLKPPAILLLLIACTLAPLAAHAQKEDAPPLDMAQVLAALRDIKEAQAKQIRAAKLRALQDVQAAAASGQAAAAAWEEAVRQVQFQGGSREGTQFRDWKLREGDGLNDKIGQNAARLFFVWLGMTLQRSTGLTNKDLLPQVIAHTKEVTASYQAVEALEESIKHDEELAGTNKNRAERKENNARVKKMHDQILGRGLAGSVVVQALKLNDWVKVENWEETPGNSEGMFQQIILPELRLAKDPRVIEYWEVKLRRETEAVSKTKLSFEIDRFNQIRRPDLLWSRAEDLALLGQPNRAATEMLTLIKNYPVHPNAPQWVTRLEALLMPKPAATPAGAPAPAQ
jgi:hypothetical protein